MAVHHPHLLDFPPPPNTVAMEAPPPSFDHGQQLLALHVDGTDMPAGVGLSGGIMSHRVLAGDDNTAAAWPQAAAVSLSLYNYNNTAAGGSSSPSLFGHHHHQQEEFAVPPAALSSPLLAPNNHQHHELPASSSLQPFQLRSSKYLGPVQELLSEFCSLQGDLHAMNNGVSKRAPKAAGGWDDVEPSSSSSSGLWGHPSLSSMDLLELERRKARLLTMVEEVERRYRRYREQMRSVEVSFEAVAGGGAAQLYTRLALRAMSRHFRCLRDALVEQVRALRKAMGAERDAAGGTAAAAAGATKGDTPRLRVLDQCLRRQQAHPGGSIDNYPWRPQRGLPERAVAVLRAWLFEHFLHPYPNDVDKHILARQTGLSRSQVSNWFINARVRLWKPMIEDMYTEEVKQQKPAAAANNNGVGIVKPEHHQNTTSTVGGSSESHHHFRASSIVVNTVDGGGEHHQLLGGYDPSSMSLTLGLQQQQPFALPMAAAMHHHQRSLSMLQAAGDQEEDEPAVLPSYCRDLMGSQLLHDLALN